jgi:uncharacterized membrane protein
MVRLVEAAASVVTVIDCVDRSRGISGASRRDPDAFVPVRLILGRFLALGREFELPSDVLRTAIAPSFEELEKLPAVATIRTAFNFFSPGRSAWNSAPWPTRRPVDLAQVPRQPAPGRARRGSDVAHRGAPHHDVGCATRAAVLFGTPTVGFCAGFHVRLDLMLAPGLLRLVAADTRASARLGRSDRRAGCRPDRRFGSDDRAAAGHGQVSPGPSAPTAATVSRPMTTPGGDPRGGRKQAVTVLCRAPAGYVLDVCETATEGRRSARPSCERTALMTRRTEEMLRSHPGPVDLDIAALAECLAACFECAQTCTACADACLAEEMVAQLRKCVRTNLDCADICQATGRVLSRHTAYDADITRSILQACAQACRSCGDECSIHAEMHEHCRICEEACRRCEQACIRLLELIG